MRTRNCFGFAIKQRFAKNGARVLESDGNFSTNRLNSHLKIMWGYIFLGFFIIIFITLCLNLHFFNLLVQIESRRFPLDWVKDEKPIGTFSGTPNAPLLRGTISRNRLLSKWVFHKPGWIWKDKKAKKLYIFFRITGLFNISIVLAFAVCLVVIFFIQP